ncbi:hypothetical protein Aaci_0529 [Alicyclobacillus acidocaldarius subsp. acidocaldarius DSM 446]|uniref:Bacterial CdiA-CT RNAse A domain-containing protein n=1 Tax=Alicyclobacillus acidocaldarius subsp. acidocaldarius (strain ATCC 27009 / DSM 446 / BCRC 14685 / JCM 5260 / KCTC 1825 / NBRC 15652 / NCIMB 11725 / NRRL B-14509 / 104-IA) TaxID=521098 RepID=C8WSS5_ALIAD|nr:hypothetical protein Aaci_0529 [Alicyclobacillus acidocaldarius subsp. acidocaldarius DSM 446]
MRPYAVAEDRYSSSHTAYHESASRAAEANRVTTRSPERDTKTSTEPSVSLAAAHITISDEAYRLYRENLAASVQSSPIVKSAQIAHPISSREYSSVNQSALHNSYASIKSEATKEDREMLRHVDTSGNEERTTSSHPTPVSVAENVGIGVFDGVKQTLGSLFHTVEHPVQTIKALGDAVSHPIETYKAMKQMAIGDIQQFKEADANQKARDIGEMVSDVGLAIVGTKGLSTVVNVISKGTEVGEIIGGVDSDLVANEVRGGHTISEHVGKTDEELLARSRSTGRPSSSYTDLKTAQRAVNENMRVHRSQIEEFMANAQKDQRLIITHDHEKVIGRGVQKNSSSVESMTRSKVVIVKHSQDGDAFILTSYPIK